MNRWARVLVGCLFGVVCVAVVTGIVFGLREVAPVLGLGVLYLFAVLPVAVLFGLGYAVAVSVLSMLAFNWFFLPLRRTRCRSGTPENWVALAVYLLTAVVVSELAARGAEARRGRTSSENARQACSLGRRRPSCRQRTSRASSATDRRRCGPGARSGQRPDRARLSPPAGPGRSRRWSSRPGSRRVGRLFLPVGRLRPIRTPKARLLPALASLLAGASDRERLRGKALEAETFRRSDATKTAILRSVSHDLRSPLTAIRAAAEGLQSGALELTELDRKELLETIRIETRRLDRLVANLLDLSLLEAGGTRPEQALWTLDDLVGRSLEMIGSASDRVHVSLPPSPLVVQVDAAQIERVLVNVLENAIKFSAEDEPVQLDAELREREVVVRVTDTGPGIPAGDAERIFEPFSRGRSGGSGLGLAIVRGFTEVNGGRVWVEPRAHGTTIATLPAGRSRARVHSMKAARILVVDDEPHILRALQTSLRGAGYDVETAAAAEAALARAAARPPDAVILDLVLPDGTGTEVARRLREWTSVPILVLSVVGEDAEKIAALDAGADDYVTKPFSIDELLARLRAALRRSGPGGEPVVEIGELSIDLEKRTVTAAGKPVSLTRTEYELLRVLAQSPGKLFTHPVLLREVWGPAYARESHYLHVYVSQLRRKIEPDPARPRYLLTEPGAGYRLVDPLQHLVRDARENDARLEQEQSLQVERALVVEEAVGAAHDELRHDDVDHGRGVGGAPPQVGEQRIAEIAVRRLDDLERDVEREPLPAEFQILRISLLG